MPSGPGVPFGNGTAGTLAAADFLPPPKKARGAKTRARATLDARADAGRDARRRAAPGERDAEAPARMTDPAGARHPSVGALDGCAT
tara:strand:- start:961 stop:1221 length:261 start_codon:yes stop_codon:yes gene_type:complete